MLDPMNTTLGHKYSSSLDLLPKIFSLLVKVCNSRICWHRKAFYGRAYLSNCSVFIQSKTSVLYIIIGTKSLYCIHSGWSWGLSVISSPNLNA